MIYSHTDKTVTQFRLYYFGNLFCRAPLQILLYIFLLNTIPRRLRNDPRTLRYSEAYNEVPGQFPALNAYYFYFSYHHRNLKLSRF